MSNDKSQCEYAKLPPYEDCFLAFIDILGFSAMVKSFDTDPNAMPMVHSVFKFFHDWISSKPNDLKVIQLSDAIVIWRWGSIENSAAMRRIVGSAAGMQSVLLSYGMLSRGGIVHGRMCESPDRVYGEALIDAHEIESKKARNPRIVIADNLKEKYGHTFNQEMISFENDECFPNQFYCYDRLAKQRQKDKRSFPLDGRDMDERLDSGFSNAPMGGKDKWLWMKKQWKEHQENRVDCVL